MYEINFNEMEFFKENTETKFREKAVQLIEKGFTVDEAIEFLTDVFYLVAREYGE